MTENWIEPLGELGSIMTTTSVTEEKILADFKQYIDDFNNEDIEGVRAHLFDDMTLYVNGKLQGTGADKMLPSWQADMNIHRRVLVSKGPKCTLFEKADADEKKFIADIEVELTATVKKEGDEPDDVQVMSVVYTYDATTMKQIKHAITV